MASYEVIRIGDLDGDWGTSSDTLGMAIGRYAADIPNLVYRADTGQMLFSVYNQNYFAIDYNAGSPRVWLGNDVNVVEITTDGLSIGSGGHISIGQTDYRTGNGLWAGYTGGAYKLSLGNYTTNQFLDWDGSNLLVSGTISASAGYIGGWALTATTIESISGGAGIKLTSTTPSITLTDGTYDRIFIGKDGADYSIILRDASGNLLLENSDSDQILAGWNIDSSKIYKTNALLHSDGYVSFGATPPTSYGNNAGVWLGYDSGAKVSLYSDANNYLQFNGSTLAWKGTNSELKTDGTLHVKDAVVSGTVTAEAGSIAGWNISINQIYKSGFYLQSEDLYLAIKNITYGNDGIQLQYNGGNPRAYIGNGSDRYFNFDGTNISWKGATTELKTDGTLHAENAVLSGTITAEAGSIGGFDIGATALTGGGTNIVLDSDNKYIAINNTSFESDGIQLQYNGGSPRFYAGNGSTEFFKYDGSNLSLKSPSTNWKTDGTLHADDAVISGTITANAGRIGGPAGWLIETGKITSTDIGIATTTGDATYAFWAGNNTPASAEFSVKHTGVLKSTSGEIGGWSIGTNTLSSSNIILDSANQAISINNSTYKQAGIQIQYNAGLSRLYVGNGTDRYLEYNGSNLAWKGVNTELTFAGTFTASDATITGDITADTGYIGGTSGWVIATGKITSTGIGLATVAGDGTYAFWAGNDTPANAEFSVTHSGAIKSVSGEIGGWTLATYQLSSSNMWINSSSQHISINSTAFGNSGVQLAYTAGGGKLYAGNGSNRFVKFDGTNFSFEGVNTSLTTGGTFTASDAIITGNVTADSGSIGGWTIGSTTLYSTNITLDSANEKIDVGNISLNGSLSRIVSDDYVSGVNGTGFLISPDLIEANNISARGMIRTSIFQKNTISTVGGNLAVLDGDVLHTDMTALDSSNVVVSGTTSFSVGDILRIKDGTDDEWMSITGVSSNTYTVTRDRAGSYSANNNPAWKKGATVVNYGQSGDGHVYMTASETNAPYLSIHDHTGSPWSSLNTRLRVGNLNGYLGYTSDIYGFGAGSSSGNNANTTIDPTNGFRIRKGTTDIFSVDNSGNALLTDATFKSSDVATQRIEISSSDNKISLYDDSGIEVIQIDDTSPFGDYSSPVLFIVSGSNYNGYRPGGSITRFSKSEKRSKYDFPIYISHSAPGAGTGDSQSSIFVHGPSSVGSNEEYYYLVCSDNDYEHPEDYLFTIDNQGKVRTQGEIIISGSTYNTHYLSDGIEVKNNSDSSNRIKLDPTSPIYGRIYHPSESVDIENTYSNRSFKVNNYGSITTYSLSLQTVTTNDTLNLEDTVTLVNSTSNRTIYLPAASTAKDKVYIIKNINTGQVTINPNSTETIDGQLTYTLTNQYESITIICDGSAWYII